MRSVTNVRLKIGNILCILVQLKKCKETICFNKLKKVKKPG